METKQLPSAESGARTIDGYREERERIAVGRNALPPVDLALPGIRAQFGLAVQRCDLIFVGKQSGARVREVSIDHKTQASDRRVVVTLR